MLKRDDPGRRLPWAELLLEAALVVLSVLLALGLNSWRQHRTDRALADQAVRNLAREIRQNRAEIEKTLPYHEMLLDTLRSAHPPLGITARPAYIQNNAWQVAQSTGAVPHMAFALVAAASAIQETQRQYQSTVQTINEVLLLGDFQARSAASMKRIPQGLAIMVSELYGLEKRLLDQYDEALALLPGGAAGTDTTAPPSGSSPRR